MFTNTPVRDTRMNYANIIDLSPERENIEILHDLLLSRGFLVELDEQGRLILSDNAALSDYYNYFYVLREDRWISDIKFLRKLLEINKLGTMGRDRVICYTGRAISRKIMDSFLAFKKFPRITGFPPEEGDIHLFFDKKQENLRAKKVQVYVLEPYVALLVKALSAVGAHSFTFCDGHGYKSMHVGFTTVPNACWAFACVELALERLEIKRQWDLSGRVLYANMRKYHSNYYRDVIRVGRFIYENRLKILEAKAKVIKVADPKLYMNEEIQRDYIDDIMWEALRDVFHDPAAQRLQAGC